MAEAEDKGKRVVDEGEAPSGDSKEVPSDEKNGVEKEVPSDEKNGVEKNGDEKEVPSDEKNGDVSVDIPTEEPSAEPKAPPKAIPEPTTLALPKDYVDPNAVPFWDPSELKRWSLWRAGIAEFIASFLFLYISVQTIIGSAANGSGGVGTLGIAFAFGVTIFVLVYAIAGISGGHINPAITFAFLLVRRVSFARFLIFVIAQVLGSLAGVGLVKAYQKGYYQRYGGGANFVHYGYSRGAGFVAELVGTFLLVYVVFTATDAKRKQRDAHVPVLAPLAIGLAVFVIHLATIPITGTGINPARSFAAACYWDHHDHAWHDQWIFWVAPLLGATVAAAYYQYVIRSIPFRYVDLASLQWGRPRPTV